MSEIQTKQLPTIPEQAEPTFDDIVTGRIEQHDVHSPANPRVTRDLGAMAADISVSGVNGETQRIEEIKPSTSQRVNELTGGDNAPGLLGDRMGAYKSRARHREERRPGLGTKLRGGARRIAASVRAAREANRQSEPYQWPAEAPESNPSHGLLSIQRQTEGLHLSAKRLQEIEANKLARQQRAKRSMARTASLPVIRSAHS